MNQEKFGQLIKRIRKEHNLTQKQLADKYGVTYQAVSKWENGKNMPDTFLMKQISEDFHISLEDLFEGEYKKKKQKKYLGFTLFLFCISILLLGTFLFLKNEDKNFEFKTLSTTCDNFNISGSIAYNKKKSAIYITNIQYCGGEDSNNYKKLDCTLYESYDNIERKVSSYKYSGKDVIKLEEFLQKVTLTVDNYETSCQEYKTNNLYLSINAEKEDGQVITYKIPLKLEKTCSK